MSRIARRAYAELYGPTTGDRVRLGDTELWIAVEEDRTVYGEEVKFGGGKVIRDGMGQSQATSAEVVDTVITNALILDYWGIVEADIGLKAGRIAAIGKAGNPDVQPGVKWSKPNQYHGNCFQLRNTMKSGSTGCPYTPRSPICRIRCMPIAYPPRAKNAPCPRLKIPQ